MADVKIIYNPQDVKRVERLLAAFPNARGKVFSRGINKTSASARGNIVKELNKKTKIKQSTIRAALRLYKATYQKWSSLIRISGKGLSLIRLSARQTRKGVSYIDPAAGMRKLLSHAFIATMPRGNKGVFLRLSKDRLPIEFQRSQSLSEIYKDAPGVASRIQTETGKELEKNIMTQVRLVLAQAKEK